jgi:HEAT repeat protein
LSSTSAAIHVTDFVRALALSWKSLASYPPGHPALVSSLDLVHRRLADLRGPAGDVSLGIATDGLIYGDTKIDSTAAQKLAQALYSRGVAVIRFASETQPADLETFLRILASGVPGTEKHALWEDLTAAGVININLQPVSYSGVRLSANLAERPERKLELSLWDEILRALLEGHYFSPGSDAPAVESAEELARMIAEAVASANQVKPTFDPDATFGVRIPNAEETFHTYLAETIGRHIAGASALKRQHSLQQAIQLIRTLPDPLRGTVLRAVAGALAEDEKTAALLRDFASELPNDEVLEALRYLSAAGKLAPHAMTLLQSLMTAETSSRAEAPSANVVSDLLELFGEDDVDRYNPSEHAALLSSVTIHIPKIPEEARSSMARLARGGQEEVNRVLQHQFTQTMLDLLPDLGESRPSVAILEKLVSIFRSCISQGDFDRAMQLLDRIQGIASTASSAVLRQSVQDAIAQLASGDTIRALIDILQGLPADKAMPVQQLTEALGSSARRNLILALNEESNRSRRRRLFDFIASFGSTIVPDATSFLNDSRWYVVRNMLVLLRVVQDRTSLPEIEKLVSHPDLRVKVEAMKSLVAFNLTLPPTLLDDLLNNPDAKVAETAISLVGTYGIKEGVDPLLRLLDGYDIFGTRRMLRLRAIRALGELGQERALDHLKRFLTISTLPWPAKEERYVAWESLNHYPKDARIEFVKKGLRSRDPRVRMICQLLVEM